MLSLPEDWDYSIAGLCAISKENETAIKSTLDELKRFGYVVVTKLMPKETESGRIEYIYDIYEEPQTGNSKPIQKPLSKKQEGEKQGLEILPLEIQGLENQGQLNTKELNTNILSKDKPSTAKSNALSEEPDKDRWNASFLKKEGAGNQNSFHKGHITNYTDKQLIEHIDKVVDYNMQPYWELYFVDGEYKTQDNNYSGELKKIILYFYQKYKEVVGKNHPIISDFGYTKIVDEYMENPPDDDVWEFKDYKRMIDKYFTVDFGRNKKPKNKIELSLSHFMSKTIREHLYYQTEPVC